MTAFYVGQRVRVNCPRARNVHGRETTIRRCGVMGKDFGGREFVGWEVNIPMSRPSRFTHCVYEKHELEPIVDDGRQVIEWSECLWQPEGIAA